MTFDKLDLYRVSWNTPICISIEDPQIPGNFLGENAFNTFEFRKKCSDAYLKLISNRSFNERSLLNGIVNYITLQNTTNLRQLIVDKFNLISIMPSTQTNDRNENDCPSENKKNKENPFQNRRKPPYKR